MLLSDQIKVLLVEDNPGDALLIKEALKESVYQNADLFWAESIANTKAFAKEIVLLLLLDLNLPDSNGLETIRSIRSDFPDSALIILTGLDDEDLAAEALRLGAQNYLTKDTITADTLSRTIRFSLERHDFIEKLKTKKEELMHSKMLLEKSEKHFRALIENSTDGLTVISEEGIVLDMSPSGRKILGYNEKEIIGKYRPDLIHPEDQETVMKAFSDIVIDPANIKLIEYRHKMPDGSFKWLECSFKNLLTQPHVHAIVLNYRDITELKKAEELKEFERRDKEALINNTDDLIWSVSKDLKLIAANHAFLYTMHTASNVMLKPGDSVLMQEAIPADVLAFWKDLYDQALSGKSFKKEIHSPPFLETEEFWTETSFNPIFKGDQVEAVACYARNITEKKTANDLLSQSEARLTEAQAVAKVGSWETDLATLDVIWSMETYRIFELAPESFRPTHSTFLEYVHPDDRANVDNAFKESFQNDAINTIQHRLITHNANLKWVEERWRVFHDSYGKPFRAAGTTQDVTERKKTEETIRRSESELREAQKLAQLGNWNFDFEADRLTWSDELYNVFDTNHEIFAETHGAFLHLVDEQDREFVRQTSQRTQQDGTPFDIEYHITTARGEKRVIHERGYAERNKQGKIIRLFGTAQNITERKKAEEQIKTEKLFSDSLINSLPGIFYLYDRDGTFARWNKNFEIISGYDEIEIGQMHPCDFYDEDEKQLIKTKIERVFSNGSDEVTAYFYTKNRTKIPYYFNGHRILLNGKDYLIGVGIDMTERDRAEKELKKYTLEIQKLTAYLDQVREEERTRIAREIHDELGQQLTGLKMDAFWIQKKIPAHDKIIKDKLSGMILLMDETVKSVRRISSDLRPGILDDLGLIAALEWQSNEFGKHSEINCEFKSNTEDLDIGHLVATSVFRIYQEALTNVSRHAKATRIQASLVRAETDFTIMIEDNGQGFNTEAVKEKQTLGLIGMRERALMAGGELHIKSEINKGTIVILRIPLNSNTAA